MESPEKAWPPQDEVLAGLPEQNEEEPESLRQNIADELNDHLQSSFTQESHRTPDEVQARNNVLNRFGDVRKIARQLWFDCMKGKLMTQRISLTVTLLMASACLGVCSISWKMLQQNQEFNSAMLEKLSAIAVTPENRPLIKDANYTEVKIKLVLGEGRGSPC